MSGYLNTSSSRGFLKGVSVDRPSTLRTCRSLGYAIS